MVFNISILGSLQNSRNAISSLVSNIYKKEITKIYLNIVKFMKVMKISIATLTPLNIYTALLTIKSSSSLSAHISSFGEA